MRKILPLIALIASPALAAPVEKVIPVPGFADFLAVDGKTVWTTNKGRVEQWSPEKKLAEVSTPHPCGGMAITAGALWVADCQDLAVKRIDLSTAHITATIPVAMSKNGERNVVAGAGAIWIASDAQSTVSRIDPATNRVIATIPTAPGVSYMAFGYGAVWAVSGKGGTIERIDPATNSVTKKTTLGKEPGFLAAGEGGIWVQEQGDGTVARIDPASGEVTGRVKIGAALKWGDIDTGGGKVWLRTTEDQTFVVIDPQTLAIKARIGPLAGSGGLRYAQDGIWTTAHDQHTLSYWANPAKIGD
jgi:virginiamycin B lyase